MKTRSILIGTCLMGGLIGLGLLTHYVYGDKQPKQKPKDDIAPKKAKSDNSPHPKRKTSPPPVSSNNTDGNRKQQQVRKTPPPSPIVSRAIKMKKPQLLPQEKPQAKREFLNKRVATPPVGDEFPLRLGSKGKRVERLQIWLMRNYGWTGRITNVFDEKTQALVKKFLRKTQLDRTTYLRMKMEKPVHLQPAIR